MNVYGVAKRVASGSTYVLIWSPENIADALESIDDWLTSKGLDEDLDLDWLDAVDMECDVRHILEVAEP